MIERDIEIINRLGLHARAAAKLVECAGRFSSKLTIDRDGHQVDAKSIMSVMMLAAGKGTRIRLLAEGSDEHEAIEALTTLIDSRFGEPD